MAQKLKLKFLVQNLRHSGSRSAYTPPESAGDISIYCRARRFRERVRANDPDVILAQEGRPGWLEFFQKDPYLSAHYHVLWKERCPGIPGGDECTPLLYKKEKFDLLDSGHFWLSATPDVCSESYEAGEGHYRISTWVKLREKESGVEFYCYTAHVDTGGITPKASFQQYYDLFAKMATETFAFVGGDFNFAYRTPEYQSAINWDYVADLQDMAWNLQESRECTFGGMNGSLTCGYRENIYPDENPGRERQLDYLWAKKHPHLKVDHYGFDYTPYDCPEEGVAAGYVSDHYGLVIHLTLNTEKDYSAEQTPHHYGDRPYYFKKD